MIRSINLEGYEQSDHQVAGLVFVCMVLPLVLCCLFLMLEMYLSAAGLCLSCVGSKIKAYLVQ